MKFEFEGTDQQGQLQQGELDAADMNAALQWITKQGWKAKSLKPVTRPASARPVTPKSQPAPPTAKSSATRSQPLPSVAPGMVRWTCKGINSRGQQVECTVDAPSPEAAVRQLSLDDVRVSDLRDAKTSQSAISRAEVVDRRLPYIAIATVADLLRAGVSPFDAFREAGTHTSNPHLAEALHRASTGSLEGRSIADALELYPGILEPHVAAFFRAGEKGGYLAEASSVLADQLSSALQVRRSLWFMAIAIVLSIPCFSIFPLLRRTLMTSWSQIDASGGQQGGDVLQTLVSLFIWPFFPLMLASTGLGYLVYLGWQRMRWRNLRHRLVLRFPLASRAAKKEAVVTFSFHLANLSKAGISPRESWWLAANSVPNLALRNAYIQMGAPLGTGSKLSQAAIRPELFPMEFAAVLRTGDLTGNIYEGMVRMAANAKVEMNDSRFYAIRLGRHLAIGTVMLVSGLVFCRILYFWLAELPRFILKDFEPSSILQFLR